MRGNKIFTLISVGARLSVADKELNRKVKLGSGRTIFFMVPHHITVKGR